MCIRPLSRHDAQDGSLRDQVRVGLTSSFLPGISLLFGALFSYTISLLVSAPSDVFGRVMMPPLSIPTTTIGGYHPRRSCLLSARASIAPEMRSFVDKRNLLIAFC